MTDTQTETAEAVETVGAAAPRETLVPLRFRDELLPAFAAIAERAVAREQERQLPFREIEELRAAGLTKLRVPDEYGGGGASLRELFAVLIELGAADSNLPQLLRGHFAFLEGRLNIADRTSQRRWFELAVDGKIFGNAQAERGGESGTSTTVTADGDGYRLSGTKYYSTGTLFADWIWSTATLDDEHVGVALPADASGVTRLDDWDGFGQRLTGSGTTRFDGVRVPAEQLVRFGADDRRAHTNITAFYQLVLLATLAGVARRALSDAVEFVRPRTRTFGVPGESSPRTDPLVQGVIGRVSAKASAAARIVLSIAGELDELHERWLRGDAEQSDYDSAEVAAFEAQHVVISLVLDATTELFEVGGASATSQGLRLDRHWRNARTIASHNPLIYRERAVGEFRLNGTAPGAKWAAARQPGGSRR